MINLRNCSDEYKAKIKLKAAKLVSMDKDLFANLSKEEITAIKKERAKDFREANGFYLGKIKEDKTKNEDINRSIENIDSAIIECQKRIKDIDSCLRFQTKMLAQTTNSIRHLIFFFELYTQEMKKLGKEGINHDIKRENDKIINYLKNLIGYKPDLDRKIEKALALVDPNMNKKVIDRERHEELLYKKKVEEKIFKAINAIKNREVGRWETLEIGSKTKDEIISEIKKITGSRYEKYNVENLMDTNWGNNPKKINVVLIDKKQLGFLEPEYITEQNPIYFDGDHPTISEVYERAKLLGLKLFPDAEVGFNLSKSICSAIKYENSCNFGLVIGMKPVKGKVLAYKERIDTPISLSPYGNEDGVSSRYLFMV